MKTLFLNADASKPNCALYDAGITYGEAFKLCKNLDVECVDIGSRLPLPDVRKYDLVIFNYQHVTCEFIPKDYFKDCARTAAFLYEARTLPQNSPMHVDGLEFSLLISPDPTLDSQPDIWGVPRVIPRSKIESLPTEGCFVISTYGYPSPWKDFGSIVRMLNEEFDQAIFRMNFPPNSHQENTGLQQMNRRLAMDIQMGLKSGIGFKYTENQMSREDLIKWLAASDLNVFLATPERGEITGGALLASTDLAISARAPIMVSDTVEARHLEQFAYTRMKDAICSQNVDDVEKLYEEWSPEAFANEIDRLVEQYL